jgi:glucose-6-phosphate isomerase
MSLWCAIPIIIALAIGYLVIYAMCKVASDADRHLEDKEFADYLAGQSPDPRD